MMARTYPALDLLWSTRPEDDVVELALAQVDDHNPVALEDSAGGVRIFFSSDTDRRGAMAGLLVNDPQFRCAPVDVPDDDWAARSQAGLGDVRVGRVLIRSSRPFGSLGSARPVGADAPDIVVEIRASMGFGTGHHASTRLCLRLLQQLPLAGRRVLDVGTGSGVLAITASKLGASEVVAIDNDTDALEAARDSVDRNDAREGVTLRLAELGGTSGTSGTWNLNLANEDSGFDLALANLTGATLIRHALMLRKALAPHGQLIASGLQVDEESAVVRALEVVGLSVVAREDEDGWVALLLRT